MDQLVKVVWHLPLKGVYHKVHPFLHHLHFRNHIVVTISVMDEWLVSYCSYLLGAWLPSDPSRSLFSTLVPSCSSSWLLGLASLWCSYSSRTWFCLVRHSTAAARVCTCLSRAAVRGSSLVWLLVAIERVSTITLFFWGVVIWLLLFYFLRFPQMMPTDDV